VYGNPAGYEGYMGRWSAALAPSFLRFARVGRPEAVLDVGCGTGSLLRAAADAFPAARLVGLDPVPAYLAHARSTMQRGRRAGLAEALPVVDAAFDCCLSLLVLQEIRDRARALGEMRRVTRSGGTIAACQWDFGRGMPVLAALWRALEAVAPEACRALDGGPARAFASAAELRRHWEAAGLVEVETGRVAATLSYGNFAELWRPLLGGSTPTTALLGPLSPEGREAVRRRLRREIAGGRDDDPFVLAAEAFVVRGRVAGATRSGQDPARGTCSSAPSRL
jgi:SAM-dependent methyltransferase